ncbi:MAG: phosphate ABC transporter substrate-binding/OmpA family protein [Bacteroidota bacterium]
MASRLTTFSKFLITLAIVAAVFFLGRYFLQNTEAGQELAKQAEIENVGGSNTNTSPSSSSGDDVIKIGVVTWGGYAGGQYFNKGFEVSNASRFYQDYGLKVEFKVLDDFEASRNAFKADEVNLLWATIDAFPTELGEKEGLTAFDPVVVFQADWSRGGDAIVARRGITKASDLKGKKIAVAEMTPSHTFLIWLLEATGLTTDDIEIIPQASTIDAAEVFKSGKVDAAVVWSPDDILCVKAVPGSRILESTRSASYIIADIFMAKRSYVNANTEKLRKLYEGWMIGAAEINSDPSKRREAAKILSEEFTERGTALSVGDADEMIGNVRLVTHGDNKNFFGLTNNYKGITGDALYSRMSDKYSSLGYIKGSAPAWRSINYPGLVNSTTLANEEQFPEKVTYTKVTSKEADLPAVTNKEVSINFRTGEFKLDENAKYIIDREFVFEAKSSANRIRIEGNTDNVGSRSSNVSLSKKRAQAVADYLISEHGIPSNRVIVKGNGPDNPVASNNTDAGRAKNRRTDFKLLAN